MRHTILSTLTSLTMALALGLIASTATAQSRFDGWASVVIAADWRDSAGQPIQAFDNARRDLTEAFLAAGFGREDMVDLSLRPDAANPVSADDALKAIQAKTAGASRGCLLYFTSHGSVRGMEFGPGLTLTPTSMATAVRSFCGERPTVVVVSACYSGIFLDALAGPNRMVMTAARRDRSSFGCGADAVYPYFDGCVIESLPTTRDFIDLGQATKACVARREIEEGLSPASEPQIRIGSNMQLLLPTLRFSQRAGAERPGS